MHTFWVADESTLTPPFMNVLCVCFLVRCMTTFHRSWLLRLLRRRIFDAPLQTQQLSENTPQRTTTIIITRHSTLMHDSIHIICSCPPSKSRAESLPHAGPIIRHEQTELGHENFAKNLCDTFRLSVRPTPTASRWRKLWSHSRAFNAY